MKEFFKFYKKLLLFQKDLWLLKIVSIVAHLLLVFLSIYTVRLIGDIVDNLADEVAVGGDPVLTLQRSFIQIIALMSFPFILEPIAYGIKDLIKIKVSRRAVQDIFGKIVNLDYQFHVNRETGSLITKITRLHDLTAVVIWNLETWLLHSVLTLTVPLVILSEIDYRLSLIMLLIVLIEFPLLIVVMKINVRMKKKSNEAEYKTNSIIIDSLSGFQLMRSFRNEAKEMANLDDKFDAWYGAELKYSNTWRLFDFVSRFISVSLFAAVSYYILVLFKSDSISVGQIVIVLSYLMLITRNIVEFFFDIRRVFAEFPRMKDVVELFNSKSTINYSNRNACACTDNITGQITIEEVGFGYDEGKKILDSLSLDIKAKSTVALAGESGGGKSTIAKLLMRFYDVAEGKILIDGIDIRNFSYDELTQIIGMVPQDPTLFNRSLFENILYGAGDQHSGRSKKELMEIAVDACKKAQIHKFIEELPDKYETMVGERGIKLSGGQKQRVAIAQIIIRDPKIVIFDEATSQLDSESEQAIQLAFDELSRDKTTIVIAHRLSTIKNSDQIFIIEKGAVVEAGKHDKLIDLGGIYAKLWRIQSGGFTRK